MMPANKLKMTELRVWNEFWVSSTDDNVIVPRRRKNIGNRPRRTTSRLMIKLAMNCRDTSDMRTLQGDAFP